MRRKLLLVIGAVLVLVGSACASDDGGGQVTADGEANEVAPEPDGGDTGAGIGALTPEATPAFMAQAAQATSEAGSYRMTMTMSAQGVDELGDGVLMTVDGAFSADGSQGEMTMDMSGMFGSMGADIAGGEDLGGFGDMVTDMFTEPWEVVVDGPDTYIRMPMLTGMLGADTEWIRTPTEDGGAQMGAGGLGQATSAAEMTRLLEGAGEVTEVGAEDVGGVPTTHYSVDVDFAALAESVGEAEAAELEGLAPGAVTMDVWIGDDGLVRRMEMVMDVGALGAGLGGGASGQILMTMEMTDFGEPVEITVPDPSQVTDAGDLGMGMLGG